MRMSVLRSRFLQSAAILVAFAAPAKAGSTTITISNDNVLNLLSPFLDLNATLIGQQTLTTNLNQAVATNQAAGGTPLDPYGQPVVQAVSMSGKTIFSGASGSITLFGGASSYYGPGANLAGALPQQALQNGQTLSQTPGAPFGNLTATPANGTIYPYQPVGGLGSLGGAYQTAVSPYAITTSSANSVTSTSTATANPLLTGPSQTQNVVNLLVNAYNFTSTDLGVAKFYFANGTTNGTSTAAPPAGGKPLPTGPGGVLPNTSTSVYDTAYGVSNTQANQNQYGSSRPAQVAPSRINQYDPNALTGLTGNPSFPSGHTTYAFTDSILIGMMTPQYFQSMVLSGSEYGNNRISLGVHYPLDIIASRSFVQYDLAQLLSATPGGPYYYTNASNSTTVLNLNGSFVSGAQSLNAYLNTQASACGGSLAACAANNPYNTYSQQTYSYQGATNAAIYAFRQNYGLPTLSLAQAPRELTDGQGNTAAILLSTLYGGRGDLQAQALANAVTGGMSGAGIYANLATATINQIIENTETQALAAFYGAQLSYWSRVDLYDAAGYFQGVTGTLTTADGDHVFTDVTVASGGVIDVTGLFTVDGNFDVSLGGALGFTVGGLIAETGYSQIDVGKESDLEGAINFSVKKGLDLTVGDTFELVAAGGGLTDDVSGLSFDGHACSALGGGLYGCGHNVEFWLGGPAGSLTLQVEAVPEPATWALMLAGFAGLGFAGYRRAKAAQALG